MRLIRIEDDGALTLVEHVGCGIPPYAILSHTWGPDQDEVTYNDIINGTSHRKPGYRKLQFCSQQTADRQLKYFWIDTCCIDKNSSAELTEAINSMFRWYRNAEVCLVYLSDVSSNENLSELRQSRWFTRGWTLQELIAPTSVQFFTEDGLYLGSKQEIQLDLHEITGIPMSAFESTSLSEFDVDERMKWTSGRQTKREEDGAYCLLGIFGVHMPLIYGEGKKNAMLRLQREIGQRYYESFATLEKFSSVLSPSHGHDSSSATENSLIAQTHATFSHRSLAQKLYGLIVQQREHVADKLKSASEQPLTEFQRSIMHTLDFESWCSFGGTFECYTKDVDDGISACTTAAVVAQHLSASRKTSGPNGSNIVYIDAADKTDFTGLTMNKTFERFWVEKFMVQALSLHASTVEALQSVLEGLKSLQLRDLSYLAYRSAISDLTNVYLLAQDLLELFAGPILIGVENSQDGGDQITNFLSFIQHSALTDSPKIHLIVVSSCRLRFAKSMKEHGRRVDKDTEHKECLQSMTFDGQDTRRSQIAHSIQNTNTWIWQHPSYVAWNSNRSSILCIEGKAGSGKSVLTKSIQQGLSSTLKTYTCDWYFSTRGGHTSTSHTSLLRSILRQILQKDTHIFQYIRKAYRCYEPGSMDLWESLPAMQDILQNIVMAGFEVRVLIDALDEAESNRHGTNARRALLAFLRDLITNTDTSSLKIIISSRPLFDLEMEIWNHQDNLVNIHRIILQEENHNTICTIVDHGIEAIRKAIRSWSDDTAKSLNTARGPTLSKSIPKSRKRNLDQFQDKQHEREKAMLARIKSYLMNNAKGVILWVISVLNILESTIRKTIYTFAELESKLKGLPIELSGLYRYYVEGLERRFDREEILKIRRALMFISGANVIKPLTLEELWDALATPHHIQDAMTSELDPIEQGRIHVKSWRDFWWALHDMCGPLVEVVSVRTEHIHLTGVNDAIDAKDNVQLSHRTVQEFLSTPEYASILTFGDQQAASLVQETLNNYASLVLPSTPTLYTGPAKREGNDWAHAVENMAEYLDDKRLLPWILDSMPSHWKEKWDKFGIFCERLQNGINRKRVCSFGPVQATTSWAALEQTEGTINAHYIEYACSNGLIVAVRVLLEILSLATQNHIAYAIIDAALLVAIKHEMVDLIPLLAASGGRPGVGSKEPDYRFWIEEQHDVLGIPQYLTPFEIAAAQTGNETIATMVYDRNHRIQKPMPWDLWPLLSKGRKYWRRSSKDWELYRKYTCKMKSEREQVGNLPLDEVRACIMLILQYTSRWGYTNLLPYSMAYRRQLIQTMIGYATITRATNVTIDLIRVPIHYECCPATSGCFRKRPEDDHPEILGRYLVDRIARIEYT